MIETSIRCKEVDLAGVRVGVPAEYYVRELPEEIVNVWNQGIEWLRSAGAQVVSLSLPTTKLCIPAYYILACAEASSNLSRYDGVRYGYRYDGYLVIPCATNIAKQHDAKTCAFILS